MYIFVYNHISSVNFLNTGKPGTCRHELLPEYALEFASPYLDSECLWCWVYVALAYIIAY